MKKQTYDLEERLLEYSVRIIKIVEQLPDARAGNHVAGQLLRSGTSPYPNHGEAQAAESPKDFIHKLRISLIVIQGLTSDFLTQKKLNCGAKRHHYSMFNVGRSMFDVQSVQCSTFIFQNNPVRHKCNP